MFVSLQREFHEYQETSAEESGNSYLMITQLGWVIPERRPCHQGETENGALVRPSGRNQHRSPLLEVAPLSGATEVVAVQVRHALFWPEQI